MRVAIKQGNGLFQMFKRGAQIVCEPPLLPDLELLQCLIFPSLLNMARYLLQLCQLPIKVRGGFELGRLLPDALRPGTVTELNRSNADNVERFRGGANPFYAVLSQRDGFLGMARQQLQLGKLLRAVLDPKRLNSLAAPLQRSFWFALRFELATLLVPCLSALGLATPLHFLISRVPFRQLLPRTERPLIEFLRRGLLAEFVSSPGFDLIILDHGRTVAQEFGQQSTGCFRRT